MTHNEVDAYRRRELAAWDPTYRPYPWHVLPEEAQNSWKNRYQEANK